MKLAKISLRNLGYEKLPTGFLSRKEVTEKVIGLGSGPLAKEEVLLALMEFPQEILCNDRLLVLKEEDTEGNKFWSPPTKFNAPQCQCRCSVDEIFILCGTDNKVNPDS